MENITIKALADKLRHNAGLIACVELAVRADVFSELELHAIRPENCNYDALDALCREYLDINVHYLMDSADVFFTDGSKFTVKWSDEEEKYVWETCMMPRLRCGGEVKKYTVFSCGISETFDKKTDAVEVALKLSDRVAVFDHCGRLAYINHDID